MPLSHPLTGWDVSLHPELCDSCQVLQYVTDLDILTSAQVRWTGTGKFGQLKKLGGFRDVESSRLGSSRTSSEGMTGPSKPSPNTF